MSRASRLSAAAAPVAVFAGALVVYALTLVPTIAAKDSGELTLAIYAWGIPHATGYPLYVLLGKAFSTLVAIGSPAYRANLFSAVCSAAAWALVAYAAYLLTGSRLSAALAGFAAAFIPPDWCQGLIANAYALLDLVLAGCLVAFIVLERGRTPRRLAVFWGLSGLAVSHHRSGVFVLVPFMAASVWMARGLGWRAWAKAAAWFALPFAAYVYIPLRGGADVRALSGTADTWKDFVDLFTGRLYLQGFFLRGTHTQALRLLGAIGQELRASLTLAGLLIGAVGWLTLARRNRTLWIASTAGSALLMLWTLGYAVETASTFVTPCYLLLALWIGLGGQAIGAAVRAWSVPVKAALMVALVAHLLVFGWPRLGRAQYWDLYDLARVTLAQAPPGALAFMDGHPLAFAIAYLQMAEKARPDVTLINAELSVRGWYRRRLNLPVFSQAAAMAEGVYGGAPDPYTQGWVKVLLVAMVIAAPPETPVCTNEPLEASYAVPGVRVARGVKSACFFKTEQPPLAACAEEGIALGEGISLAEANLSPARAAPGDLVTLELHWRCAQPVVRPWTAEVVAARPAPAFGFRQSAPFLMGLAVGATPPGRCYVQRIPMIVPRDAGPGVYAAAVALREGATMLGPVAVAGLEVAR